MTLFPCCRISTLVFGSDKSTTTRPSFSAPRRKSIPRKERPPVKAEGPAVTGAAPDGDACAAVAGAVPGAARKVLVSAAPPSATSTRLPSTDTVCVIARFRFTTTRERPPDCTTLTERTSPWFSSTMFLPSPFTVAGISSATRAGFATEKLAGTPCGAFFNSMLTTTPLLV